MDLLSDVFYLEGIWSEGHPIFVRLEKETRPGGKRSSGKSIHSFMEVECGPAFCGANTMFPPKWRVTHLKNNSIALYFPSGHQHISGSKDVLLESRLVIVFSDIARASLGVSATLKVEYFLLCPAIYSRKGLGDFWSR
jgi:hypothetical protein